MGLLPVEAGGLHHHTAPSGFSVLERDMRSGFGSRLGLGLRLRLRLGLRLGCRSFTPVYGCLKAPRKRHFCATMRHCLRGAAAVGVVPHVEVAQENRNLSAVFPGHRKRRGAGRAKAPRRVAGLVHYV